VDVRSATSPDGIEIRYEVDGAGEPAIVFVHGWSCDRTYWRFQVGEFARRHRVVAVDLGGHGDSGLGRPAWTMAAFGADVTAVVEHEDLHDVVLVGHSMGGDAVDEAAVLLGDRVRGVVWVDTYPDLEPSPEAANEAFLEPFRGDLPAASRAFVHRVTKAGGPGLAEWIANDMAAAPREVAMDALSRALGAVGPTIDALARIDAPVVAINPDAVPDQVASLARHGVRHVPMVGVGHFEMLEDPPQFNRVLAEVVAGFPRRAGAAERG
jgi:pimeloyl-ACP methyl ester carboxylesterase